MTTIHGFSGPAIMPVYRASRSALVSISLADRAPGLDYAANVYHGVDSAELPFDAAGGDSLVSFGRIHPDKGTAEAIEIAAAAGRRLVICGIVHDEAYFRECVEPRIDGDRVTYLGSVGPRGRAQVLGSAAALLHPVAFAEPFGLSVVESMMCGTPVIAFERGSMREIVDPGRTGFLVSNVAEAAGRGRRGRRHSTALPAGRSRSSASRPAGWSTTTCASTTPCSPATTRAPREQVTRTTFPNPRAQFHSPRIGVRTSCSARRGGPTRHHAAAPEASVASDERMLARARWLTS